ncbi:MAG: FAD-binding protein, partial [Clostridia bacterium]|nr:FAD-binding protein [Clostridia bacterium]
MVKLDISLPLTYNTSDIKDAISVRLGLPRTEILECELVRRTLVLSDKSNIHYKATVAFSASKERETGLLKMRKLVSEHSPEEFSVPTVHFSTRPVVIGAGPAGLFAALALAEAGARPIIYERGLPIHERNARVSAFRTIGVLDPECNIQYGEGGAGTYSDGKLKVGSMDKYKMKVLRTFVECGADDEIIYSVGAHVGTDVLSGIVEKIRERIISLGGEVHFGTRLCEIYIKNGKVVGGCVVRDESPSDFETDTLIMATGHSARDSFEVLSRVGAPLTRRGFGIGMRIEHPREHINNIVYGKDYPDVLGSASYHLVTHLSGGRSVYSFCMCPGGVVVPAASEIGGIVTNGMSEHARMADNSNSALLVSVTPEDFGSDDIFAGLELQRNIEKAAFLAACGDYKAPTTSLSAFMKNGAAEYGDVKPSYTIGTRPVRPEEYLPSFITDSLR